MRWIDLGVTPLRNVGAAEGQKSAGHGQQQWVREEEEEGTARVCVDEEGKKG